MLRSSLIPSAVLASALLLGCGEQPAPSEPSTAPPSFRTTNNPDGPGAFVFRTEGGVIGFGDTDASLGITYSMGFSVAELAQACAEGFGEPPTSPGFELVVLRPDESILRLFRVTDAPLLVWEGFSADICATPLFAIGTGQFILNGNDVTFSADRANSFGFRLHGTVSAVEDGQGYHLWQKLHVTVLSNGEVRVDSEERKFTPIG